MKLVSLEHSVLSQTLSHCAPLSAVSLPRGAVGNLLLIQEFNLFAVNDLNAVFPIDFNKCQEEIACSLQEFCNLWCKREHVESNALNTWKFNIFSILLIVEFHFIAII